MNSESERSAIFNDDSAAADRKCEACRALERSRLYQSLPCGIIQFTTSPEPIVVSINPAAIRIYDSPVGAEELIGKPVYPLLHGDDLTSIKNATVQRLDSKDAVIFDTTIKTLEGMLKDVTVSLDLITAPDGSEVFQAVFFDVTSETQARLDRELNRYSTALFNVYDEVFLFDYVKSTSSLLVSRMHCNAGSVAPLEESMDRWCDIYVYEDDRDSVRNMLSNTYTDSGVSTLEYRVQSPTRGLRWCASTLLSLGGNRSLLCNSDITEKKDAERIARENASLLAAQKVQQETVDKLRWQDERNRLFIEGTNSIMFDYDPKGDTLTYYAGSLGKGMTEHTITAYQKYLSSSTAIHPDSINDYRQALLNASLSPVSSALEFSADLGLGYRWYCAHYVSVADNDNVYRIVGRVDDIQNERDRDNLRKELEATLRQRAEIDYVTGILNKGTAEKQIKALLNSKETTKNSAIMVLDIDDFKLVNDTHGHLSGDYFLGMVGKTLKHFFRGSDVLGRLGGDEFIVFMCNAGTQSDVRHRAELLLKELSGISTPEGMHIQCSVGIYMFDSGDYDTVIGRADYALYEAKARGKGTYVFFNEATMDISNTRTANGRTAIDPLYSDSGSAPISEQVFKLLYTSPDTELAIASILEVIGRHMDVSRVYIFEDSPDGKYCSNTFEWCSDDIAPEKDNLQNVSYDIDLGGTYRENFDNDGVFYCPDISQLPKQQYDILAPQGILSMLQCAIIDGGIFKGYIGFDECRRKRFWNEEQISTLVTTAKLVGTFLVRMRNDSELKEFSASMRSVLEHYSAFVYIIDPDTYEVVYCNRRLDSTLGQHAKGTACYKVFRDRESPCPLCPVSDMINSGSQQHPEIFNPKLNKWYLSEASTIHWNGRDMVLITANDITKYKQ